MVSIVDRAFWGLGFFMFIYITPIEEISVCTSEQLYPQFINTISILQRCVSINVTMHVYNL